MILTVCANPSVDSFWKVGAIDRGTTNRSEKESFFPGGKGIHTALALAELDRQVTTLGLWGGQTGQWLKKECHRREIETIGPLVDEWSRICITMRSDTDWNETELLGGGPTAGPDAISEFEQAYTQYLQTDEAKAILLTGSVPNGFNMQFFPKLVGNVRMQGVRVFLTLAENLMKKTIGASPIGSQINNKEARNFLVRKIRWP